LNILRFRLGIRKRSRAATTDQLPKSAALALNIELLHARLQSGASKPKRGRRAVRTRDFSVGFPQSPENPFALGRFV
jgi:hypothetical protein